jgi:hypothetical protein
MVSVKQDVVLSVDYIIPSAAVIIHVSQAEAQDE